MIVRIISSYFVSCWGTKMFWTHNTRLESCLKTFFGEIQRKRELRRVSVTRLLSVLQVVENDEYWNQTTIHFNQFYFGGNRPRIYINGNTLSVFEKRTRVDGNGRVQDLMTPNRYNLVSNFSSIAMSRQIMKGLQHKTAWQISTGHNYLFWITLLLES